MAKKGLIKRVTEYLEGDREPGEEAPADDSHIKTGNVEPIRGHGIPEDKPEPESEDQEEEYQVEIGGTMRKVNEETYNLVMEERANRPEPELVPAPEPAPEPEGEFDQIEFFGDPEPVLQKIKEDAVSEATQKISRQYAVDKAQNEFWSAFYQENPKLSGEEMLVKLVMGQNIQQLRNLSDGKEGRDKLAELVEGEILRIANKQRSYRRPDGTSRLEGGSAPEPTPASSDVDQVQSEAGPRPPSMGDALKSRKLKRQRAQRGESTQLS